MSIIVALLVLSFLIFIHELGHYLAAKFVGVKVEEFSIGFPPRIVKKKIKETIYSLGLLPFGGYVRLLGMNFEDEDSTLPQNYASKKISQRALVILAGPIMNILLAMAVIPFVYYLSSSRPLYLGLPAQIYQIKADGFAASKGFRDDDEIIALNKKPVKNWNELNNQIEAVFSEFLVFDVLRANESLSIQFSKTELNEISSFDWFPKIPPIVGEVIPGSAAENAGFLKGDRIFSIGGEPVEDFQQIPAKISKFPNQTLAVGVERNDDKTFLKVLPLFDQKEGRSILGIRQPQEVFQRSFGESVKIGFLQLISLTKHIFLFLGNLASGSVTSDEVGGPITIVKIIGDASQTSFSNLLFIISFISFQLAILNLLPIPALDGGHLLLLLAEKIKGKTISINFRRKVQIAGGVFLVSLMSMVILLDIFKFF